MGGGRVALVARVAVLGVEPVVALHRPVAGDLGEYRRRHDGGNQRVALDDGEARLTKIGKAVAVNVDLSGKWACGRLKVGGQAKVGAPHRQEAGAQNVEFVDLGGVCPGDAPAEGKLDDELEGGLSARGREGLRVGQDSDGKAVGEDDGACADGPREGAATRLVDAADPGPEGRPLGEIGGAQDAARCHAAMISLRG